MNTKLNLMNKYVGNHKRIVNNILHENQVLVINSYRGQMVINSYRGQIFAHYLKQRYSFPLHLSEETYFLSLKGIAMRKSLPERISKQINHL